jgi:hypothetical protein
VLGKYFSCCVTVFKAIYLDLYLSHFNVKVFIGMGYFHLQVDVTLLGPWVLSYVSKHTKGPLKYRLHHMSYTVVTCLSELFL